LYRYFALSFSAPTASDLVQECLIRVVSKYESGGYDSARGSLRALAFGIAHYVRLEALRARHAEVELAGWEGEAPSGEEAYARAEERARLRRAITDLSEGERQVVSLYLDRDLKLEEIARILSIPLGTVKSHLHRAKENLRKVLNETEGAKNG
jgi:RNA polymerase sigma-70 factor (ECF subfamily)